MHICSLNHRTLCQELFLILFDGLQIQQVEFAIRVSFLEIYNEELLDLLSPTDDSSKLRYNDVLQVI
jgi:hypothetical protein